jgi:hypothetical protein
VATEVWLRNTFNEAGIAISEGVDKYAWSRTAPALKFKSVHAVMRENFLGSPISPTYMVVTTPASTAYTFASLQPFAFWPTWHVNDGLPALEKLLASPMEGQPHRVLLAGLHIRTPEDRKYTLDVRALCAQYPDAIAHLTSGHSRSYELLFGYDWPAIDVEFNRYDDHVILPHGMILRKEEFGRAWYWQDWIELLGFKIKQITDPEASSERFRFNVRSLMWAADNYHSEDRIRRKYSPTRKIVMEKDLRARLAGRTQAPGQTQWRKAKAVASRSLPILDEPVNGDYSHCDHCSLRSTCNLARAGMVCALKGSEMGDLSKHFGTRNADSIIDGLGKLLVMQADRAEDSLAQERMSGDDPNPEVTRQLNAVFKNGTLLAKLIDPNLNGKGTTINNNTLNVNGGATSNSPRSMLAEVVKQLELAGIPRNEITPDMIKTMLTQGADRPALEGVVVQNEMERE